MVCLVCLAWPRLAISHHHGGHHHYASCYGAITATGLVPTDPLLGLAPTPESPPASPADLIGELRPRETGAPRGEKSKQRGEAQKKRGEPGLARNDRCSNRGWGHGRRRAPWVVCRVRASASTPCSTHRATRTTPSSRPPPACHSPSPRLVRLGSRRLALALWCPGPHKHWPLPFGLLTIDHSRPLYRPSDNGLSASGNEGNHCPAAPDFGSPGVGPCSASFALRQYPSRPCSVQAICSTPVANPTCERWALNCEHQLSAVTRHSHAARPGICGLK